MYLMSFVQSSRAAIKAGVKLPINSNMRSNTIIRKTVESQRLVPNQIASFSFTSSNHANSTSLPTTPPTNPASRPFARHKPDLPQPKSYKTPAILLILFSVVTWSGFTIHATNRERLSSAVLKNVVDKIRENDQVLEQMGDDVNLKRETILAGDPWIRGSVNMMQGRVDMSFKLKGSKDTGTVYFSSIRRDAQTPYETLRFLIVLDSNKKVISLLDS